MDLTRMSRRGFLQLAGTLGVSTLLGGCGSMERRPYTGPTDPQKVNGVFRIGGIAPLTGPAAIYGTANRDGALVAVKEVNDSGRLKLELNFQDDEHDPEKAVNAYNNLKDWGLKALVGTTTTGPCVAVTDETNADGVFQVTPSASSIDVIGGVEGSNEPAKHNVFQICFTDPNQGTASASYIAEQKLADKVAVIYNNADAYSTGIFNNFQAKAEELGLNIVSESTFTDDSANDFTVQLNAAKSEGADLIFLPVYYTPASIILQQADAMGYQPKFFGVDGMDGILSLEGFDKSVAEGVMLLTPFVATAHDERTQRFVQAYKELTGSQELPSQFAADGYDCVMAIVQAIEVSGVTPEMPAPEICERLSETFIQPDFVVKGLTGDARWLETGEVDKSPKGMIIKNGVYEAM